MSEVSQRKLDSPERCGNSMWNSQVSYKIKDVNLRKMFVAEIESKIKKLQFQSLNKISPEDKWSTLKTELKLKNRHYLVFKLQKKK